MLNVSRIRRHLLQKTRCDVKPKKKKHQCDKCGVQFKTGYNMKIHMKTAHAEIIMKYGCKICGQEFTTINNLWAHYRKSHDTFDYKESNESKISFDFCT